MYTKIEYKYKYLKSFNLWLFFVVVIANILTCILGIFIARLSLITFMRKKEHACLTDCWLMSKVRNDYRVIYMMARSRPLLTEFLFSLLKGYLVSFLSFLCSFGNIIYIFIKSWLIFTKLPKSCLIGISN